MGELFLCNHILNLSGICQTELCPLFSKERCCLLEISGLIFLMINRRDALFLPGRRWIKVILDSSMNVAIKEIDLLLCKCGGRIVRLCKRLYTSLMSVSCTMMLKEKNELLSDDFYHTSIQKNYSRIITTKEALDKRTV